MALAMKLKGNTNVSRHESFSVKEIKKTFQESIYRVQMDGE